MKQKKNWKEFVPGIVLSIVFSFMLCVFAPLEMYFTNIDEFWFDVYLLLPVALICFAAAAVISVLVMLVLFLINRRVYQAGLIIEFIVFICTYIQGNYMVASLPALDGNKIDWSKYMGNIIAGVVMWIIIIAGVVVFLKVLGFKKFCSLVTIAGVCMFLMFDVTLASVSIGNEGWEHKTGSECVLTDRNMLEMSDNSNFIILLLDAVDSGMFTQLLNSNQAYKDVFTDFTNYTNTLSAYPFTKHSIPYILTGDWYENDEKFSTYYTKAMTNSKLFSMLENRKYKMDVYEDELEMDTSYASRFDNIIDKNKGINSYRRFIELESKLVAFRYLPYGFKQSAVIDMTHFKQIRGKYGAADMGEAFTASNMKFYDKIMDGKINKTDKNCFKFIHVEGAHVPFKYDKNMNYIDDGTYFDNLEACVKLTATYFDQLKNSGVYDNSVIIVMSDHGYNYDETYGRQNPILFVKGINEKHEYRESDAPISYEDLNTAYERLLNGSSSDQIFDYKSGDLRQRRFLFYYFENDEHMVEYTTTGNAADTDKLMPTGREYDKK